MIERRPQGIDITAGVDRLGIAAELLGRGKAVVVLADETAIMGMHCAGNMAKLRGLTGLTGITGALGRLIR